MRRTFDGRTGSPARSRSTWSERALVLGGFAIAAPATAWSAAAGAGIEPVAAAWLLAGAWAFVSSLALALRRGFRDRDRTAFGRRALRDRRRDRLDWSLKSGRYAHLRIAERNRRLMRGD